MQAPRQVDERRYWGYRGMMTHIVGICLALFTGTSGGFLPSDATAVLRKLRNWGNFASDANAPLQQMTTFAEATVAAANQAEDSYLTTLFMEDARSYFMVDSMETEATQKEHAVRESLNSANIPENTSDSILKQVKYSKNLQKQYSNFFLDTTGKAVLLSINIWMVQKGSDVQIALMLCGSELKQAEQETPVEIEEVQYQEVTTTAQRWWTGWQEIVVTKHPVTVDGKTPLRVKKEKRITDPKKMKPSEVQQLKDYLVSLASRSMLQNNAPHKLPTTSRRLEGLSQKEV